MTPLTSCLSCGRHPSTHLPATPDSDDACGACGLAEERGEDGGAEASSSPAPCPTCHGVGFLVSHGSLSEAVGFGELYASWECPACKGKASP